MTVIEHDGSSYERIVRIRYTIRTPLEAWQWTTFNKMILTRLNSNVSKTIGRGKIKFGGNEF